MNINLPTGKTICVSVFEYYFILKEEDVDAFFQSCVADDLGEEVNNPFSSRPAGRIEVEEDIDELEE